MLRDVVAAIRRAATDPRVAGLVADFSGQASPGSLAQCQELRSAIAFFRAAQKSSPTVAHADEFSTASKYLLASAFESVYQAPSASFKLPGLSLNLPFFSRLLAHWGLTFEVTSVGGFKNGYDALSAAGPSANHTKASRSLLRSSYEHLVADIAASRRLSERAVRRLSHAGWTSTDEAVGAQLLDGGLHADQLESLLDARCATKERCSISEYQACASARPLAEWTEGASDAAAALRAGLERATLSIRGQEAGEATPHAPPPAAATEPAAAAGPVAAAGPRLGGRRKAVAVICATGKILRDGDSSGGSTATRPAALRAQLREARDDARVAAVVLRIDSAGGDALASEAIWREVHLLREAGKPVVASLGSYAASGGCGTAGALRG